MPGQWPRLTPFLPQSRAFATKNSCLFPLFVPLCYNLPLCYNVPLCYSVPLCSTVTVLLSFQSVRKITNIPKGSSDGASWNPWLLVFFSRRPFQKPLTRLLMVDLGFQFFLCSFLPRLPFQNLQELILDGKFNMSEINVKKQKNKPDTVGLLFGVYGIPLFERTYIKTPNGWLPSSWYLLWPSKSPRDIQKKSKRHPMT